MSSNLEIPSIPPRDLPDGLGVNIASVEGALYCNKPAERRTGSASLPPFSFLTDVERRYGEEGLVELAMVAEGSRGEIHPYFLCLPFILEAWKIPHKREGRKISFPEEVGNAIAAEIWKRILPAK